MRTGGANRKPKKNPRGYRVEITAPLQGPRSIGISFVILSKLFCIPKGELHLGLHSVHVGYIFLKYKYIIVYFMNI